MVSSTRSVPRLIAGGLGAYLAGLGLASWDDFGAGTPYDAASAWPVFLGPEMPTSPDRVIVITPGGTTYRGGNVEQGAQIRLRGAARATADEVADHVQAIEDAFRPNGFPLAHVDLGEIRVGLVALVNGLPLGPDGNGRHGHTINVRVRARRPGTGTPTPDTAFGAGIFGEGIFG